MKRSFSIAALSVGIGACLQNAIDHRYNTSHRGIINSRVSTVGFEFDIGACFNKNIDDFCVTKARSTMKRGCFHVCLGGWGWRLRQ